MSKHSWTEQELRIVCVCYKAKLPIELALLLTNTTNAKSMEMRYQNCLFLEKGRVEGSLSHASKTLTKVWNELEPLFPKYEQNNQLDTIIMALFITCIFTQLLSLFLVL